MFKALIGNLFDSHATTLVNTVNCVGVMGKGVALEFKRRFPTMYVDYAKRCERRAVKLGEPYIFRDPSGIKIINFPTKGHWRSSSRLSDIEQGLDHLADHISEWSVESLALPPLGCGNGGLAWSEVGPLIYSKLHKYSCNIEVFAPYGTPKGELTDEFLGRSMQLSLLDSGKKFSKMPNEWAVIVETVRELQSQPYAAAVGRTIFQKICYILTALGLETGFSFGRGNYGPFATEVKDAQHIFANRNWIQEKPLGRMIAISVGRQYDRDRSKFYEIIDKNKNIIDKTVDLFSRIKSTDQAEELMTIIYACQEMKSSSSDDVSEEELINFIADWKKSWGSDERRASLSGSIRNLVMLGWIKVRLPHSIFEDEPCQD